MEHILRQSKIKSYLVKKFLDYYKINLENNEALTVINQFCKNHVVTEKYIFKSFEMYCRNKKLIINPIKLLSRHRSVMNHY